MIAYELEPGTEAACFLPTDYWQRRGDVCLYADRGEVCFVERNVAGYVSVAIFNPKKPAETVQLHPDEAATLCAVINKEVLAVNSDDVDEIVASSFLASQKEVGHAVSH